MMAESPGPDGDFYGPQLARIHHARFGELARSAAGYLLTELAAGGQRSGTVVDLGCGSGILAGLVCDAGYQVLGIDISAAMIELARQQAPGAGLRVGSLHEAGLPAGCVAVTAIGECVNYAVSGEAGPDAFERLARRVHAALGEGGLFLLDVSGPTQPGVAQRFHQDKDWCLGMIAEEAADPPTLTRRITIFAAGPDGCYQRHDEHHQLRLLARPHAKAILLAAGFEVGVRPGYQRFSLTGELPGWYVIHARKPGQQPGLPYAALSPRPAWRTS
ncbi:MAG TPA: class I SAM-dependent methyltransferase [Streptosporangiaceae bacterium]